MEAKGTMMNRKPPFWKVRLEEIAEVVGAARKGCISEIARSAGSRPVFAIAYGEPLADERTTNLSGSMGAGDPDPYKPEPAMRQTAVLVGGCHGAEMEATAGLLNLIQTLETGRDFSGRDRSELAVLAASYRLVIIPCLNPDGRARSPDSMIGLDSRSALEFNQGTWKDGTPIGYPACKRYQPLPKERVAQLGGYPNDDGYNLMHDATPGAIATAEVRGLLQLVDRERADLVLHLHSHGTAPAILPPNHGMFDLQRRRILYYRRRLEEWFLARGLDVLRVPHPDPAATWLCPFNLASLTALTSGALSPVFEQPSGVGRYPITPEIQLEMALQVVHLFLHWGLREAFSPRHAMYHSMLDASQPLATYHRERWKVPGDPA